MDKKEKYYCDGHNCKNEIPKPVMCCNSFDCGCMGMPTEPPFCSEECYTDYMESKRSQDEDEGTRVVESYEQHGPGIITKLGLDIATEGSDKTMEIKFNNGSIISTKEIKKEQHLHDPTRDDLYTSE